MAPIAPMASEVSRTVDFDPFSAAVMADPAVGHAALRRCPVQRYDDFDPPFYTLSTYEDLEWALRDIETFSSQFGQGPRFSEPIGLLCDPPQHTRYRALLQGAFTPRLVEGLRPRVQQLTDELVDGFEQRGHCDLHDDFAFPLPVVIIAELLGVPQADMDRFKHWSDMQVAALGAKDPSPYLATQQQYQAYLLAHIRQRREVIAAGERVPDDLLTLIAGAREAGELLPEEDVLSMVSQLLVGGNETTTSLITNLIWRLLQQPQRWQHILADPALVEAAVEESLRYDPPVLGLYRHVTRDVSVRGTVIPKGSKVLLHYAAACRDPAVFDQPDHFDLHRPRKRHLAFGLGVHFCLGAPLARLEGEIALATLARRLPDLRLEGDGERITPFFLWGRRTLPVSWGTR